MRFEFSPWPNISTAIHAPLSGDVVQSIEPRVFSPDISGDPDTEYRIHRNVASYGKQLGKILEALETLSKKTKVPLPEIEDLIAGIEDEKAAQKATLRRQAEEAMARLKEVDEEGWRDLRR